MNSVTMHGDLFHGEMMPKLLIVLFALSLGTSCTTQPLTEAELEARDYRRAIDKENWRVCELAYKQAGRYTVHTEHIHDSNGNPRGLPEIWAVKRDLADNNCRMMLGEYWADY